MEVYKDNFRGERQKIIRGTRKAAAGGSEGMDGRRGLMKEALPKAYTGTEGVESPK